MASNFKVALSVCVMKMVRAGLASRGVIFTLDTEEIAARQIIEQGSCEILVLSLGAQGTLLATAEGCERFAAIPVEARSTWVPATVCWLGLFSAAA
jgi:fructose-1-phosphate kinase PfkB-like protein